MGSRVIMYYKKNALCDYLKNLSPQFIYSGDYLWQLVYGDEKCNPKLLVLARGTTYLPPYEPLNENELERFKILFQIKGQTNLPLKVVSFPVNIPEIQEVYISDDGKTFTRVPLDDLGKIYASYGLPIENTKTKKYLNDKVSSAYHKWQRETLGRKIKVSDIDLWKLDDNGQPRLLFEIKRSGYDLQKWEPWPDDYPNFTLLAKLILNSDIKFYIVYYQRIKKPYEEKIDKLKIYSVKFDASKNEECAKFDLNYCGIFPLKTFVDYIMQNL